MNKVLSTIALTIVLTLVFLHFENKSNFSPMVMLPIIVSLIVEYILGDWDEGYRYTWKDLAYFGTTTSVSAITVGVYNI
jgi:hypothetical protein